jgi:hypothetical protein
MPLSIRQDRNRRLAFARAVMDPGMGLAIRIPVRGRTPLRDLQEVPEVLPEKSEPSPRTSAEQPTPAESGWHFAVLYVVTFGFYGATWAYRIWKHIRDQRGISVSPFWRTVFFGFYIPSLVRVVSVLAAESGASVRCSVWGIALGYWCCNGLWSLPGALGFLGLLTGFQCWRLQQVLNTYWSRVAPDQPVRTSFSNAEIVGLVLGGMAWALFIFGLMLPAGT